MEYVMCVIVPLCREASGLAVGRSLQAARLIFLVLEYQMHRPSSRAITYPFRELIEKMTRTIVHYGMHRIEPQPIKMELANPIHRIFDEEAAHRSAVGSVEIAPGSPGSFMTVRVEFP